MVLCMNLILPEDKLFLASTNNLQNDNCAKIIKFLQLNQFDKIKNNGRTTDSDRIIVV